MLHFPNKAQKQVNTPSTHIVNRRKNRTDPDPAYNKVQSAPTAFSSKMASSCALASSLRFSLRGGKTTNCQKGEKNKELQRQARGTQYQPTHCRFELSFKL